VAIVNPANPAKAAGVEIVRLTNGDLLEGTIAEIADENVSIDVSAINRKVVVPMAEVKTIRFDNALVPSKPGQRDWFTMLDDRSVLKTDVSNNFNSQTFEQLTFNLEQISCFWFGKNKVRFPVEGDFGDGDEKAVLVFPTCRLAVSGAEFSDGKMTWGETSKLQQDTDLDKTDDDPNPDDDPTPNVESIDFAESPPENIPTVWMKPPNGKPNNKGMVRLTDGQQFVLGGTSGFRITKLDNQSVTIEIEGNSQRIPNSRILSVDFPVSD
jgi:preprotein translocase subunit YajC